MDPGAGRAPAPYDWVDGEEEEEEKKEEHVRVDLSGKVAQKRAGGASWGKEAPQQTAPEKKKKEEAKVKGPDAVGVVFELQKTKHGKHVGYEHRAEAAATLEPAGKDKLWCTVCEVTMSTKASTWKKHCSDMHHSLWVRHLLPAVRPALEYFWNLLVLGGYDETDDDFPDADSRRISFGEQLSAFKFAQIFHPREAFSLIDADDFSLADTLQLPAMRSLADLEKELVADFGSLIALYNEPDVKDRQFNPEELLLFWREHGSRAKSWAAAAQRFVILRPSSSMVERLFSIYQHCLPVNMLGSHEDTQELRMFLNFERLGDKSGRLRTI